jgi:hypothetical protein
MRVLRFIWRGVLAFDRSGSRIPQLVQIWLIEVFFALPEPTRRNWRGDRVSGH